MIPKKRLALPARIHPAVISVWAAVVASAHIVPTIPILGTGRTFSLANVLNPLSGILFGPIAGALCSAAGGFVGSLVAPHTAWLGPGTFVIGATTAFATGCAAWGTWPPVALNSRGSLVVNGGIIVYLVGTALWFSQKIGRSLAVFPLVYYGAGFIAFIIASVFAAKVLIDRKKNQVLKLLALWLCAFGGMIGGATVGNFFALVLYENPREFWIPLMVFSPLERAAFSLVAALVAAPLLAGLPKVGIFAGPQEEADDELPPPEGGEP